MIKHLPPILTFLVTGTSAVAGNISYNLSLGIAKASDRGNGAWYQEGLPHNLDLRTTSISLGMEYKLSPEIVFHAKYTNLGVLHSDAIATPVDSNYSSATRSCIGACVALSRFVGSGKVQGIELALEHSITNSISAYAGIFPYHSSWRETVYNWKQHSEDLGITIEVARTRKLDLGIVFGASYKINKSYSLNYRYYKTKDLKDSVIGIQESYQTLSLEYRF